MDTGTVFRDLGSNSDDPEPTQQGNLYVAVIGIDTYQQWPKLVNAVSDAEGFRRIFVEKLGFLEIASPLLNNAATKEGITALVHDELRRNLVKSDSLVLFFAGHGHTRVDQVGNHTIETGYIVPVEARKNSDEFANDLIPIDPFLQAIGRLPARHILVVLDACHSGFALGDAMKIFRSSERYMADMRSRFSRKVITSARRDQLALDTGPVAGHSLFTGTLIDGFNWGRADLDGNGLVTSSELGLFLQQQVGQHSKSKQTPDCGVFAFDDRGELVISLSDDTFATLKAHAFAALQSGERDRFSELAEKVIVQRPESPEALYIQYRLRFDQGNIADALTAVEKLLQQDLSKGAVPLSIHDLEELAVKLRFWDRVYAIPEGDFPLEVIILAGSQNTNLSQLSHLDTIGAGYYELPENSILQFQFANTTDKMAHIYMINIDAAGRPTLIPLWQDYSITLNGLQPGQSEATYPLRISNHVDVNEARFFYSDVPRNLFLNPPEVITRSLLPPVGAEDAAGLLRKSIYYRVARRT